MTLALGVATTSFAATYTKNAVKAELPEAKATMEVTSKAKKAAMANEEWTVVGQGTYADGIFAGMYNAPSDPVEVTIEKSGSKYRVTNPWPNVVNGAYLIIDATDPEFVLVPEQNTGFVDQADGATYIASASAIYSAQGVTKAEFLASDKAEYNITLRDNVIYFPGNSVLFNWPNANGVDTNPTSWYRTNNPVSGYLQLPGGVVVQEWETQKGTYEFSNGIISTLTGDEVEVMQVQIQKNNQRAGVYRVLNAYGEGTGNLELNISDPTDVTVAAQPTGVGFQGGLGALYIGGDNLFKDHDIFATYNANTGIVNFPAGFIYYRFPSSTNASYDPQYFYSMENALASSLQLPLVSGINDMTIDENAPVEYFNMQGMRVANPEAGQMVIARQGNKAVKMIVK